MPKLSIITINLNNKQGLLQTIQSVREQTFTDFEYIVIDGASTDGSVEVITEYASLFSYSVSEPDTGVYHAMNKGILQATGEYCLFLNSGDCLYDSETLQKVFSQNFSEDIVYGDSMNGDIYCRYPEKLTPLYLFRKPLLHQATFIKRSLFNTYGLYNEQYNIVSDWEFFLKVLYKEKCSYKYLVNTPIVYFDMGGINNTQKERLELEKQEMLLQIYATAYDEYKAYDAMWADLQDAQQTIKKIGHIQNSWEYRIGRVLLWPVRKILNNG